MLNLELLITFVAVFLVVLFLWISIRNSFAIRKSSKLQKQINDALNNLLIEQKRANKLLSIIGGVNIPELPEEQESAAKIYIGNLDYAVDVKDLEKIFVKFGKIKEINIPVNKYTKKGRGFGFIEFANLKSAEKALSLDGYTLNGRPIQVCYAK